MDGVIVMRPAAAWARADHPLDAVVSPITLHDARVSQGFDAPYELVQIDDSTAVRTVEPILGLGGRSFPLR